jgi:hypothetical protein
MPGTQLINNGVTTGGFGAMTLDMTPSVDQFVKGQQIEQDRRRRVIQNNENQLNSVDVSKLTQEDLSAGIGAKYEEYKKLGMDTNYKDFNKHDAQMRSTHQQLQNQILSAITARKANMTAYDDVKGLLTPEAQIKMQNDLRGSVINPDGSYKVLNANDYKLKPKDYVDVHAGIIGILKDNTEKPQIMDSQVRADGKYNKLTATRINVENAIATTLEKYKNDTKWAESVDHTVTQLNAKNPEGTPITPEDYVQNIVEREIAAKQSDRSKQLYPKGIYAKGNKDTYVDVAPSTPSNYVSHVTVNTGGDKAAAKSLALYNKANEAVTNALASRTGMEGATSLLTTVVKGSVLGGNQVTGAQIIGGKGLGRMGIRVNYMDPFTQKFFPKEYYGENAKTIMGLLHNSKVKSTEAIVEPGLHHAMEATPPTPAPAPKKKVSLNPMTWGSSKKAAPVARPKLTKNTLGLDL